MHKKKITEWKDGDGHSEFCVVHSKSWFTLRKNVRVLQSIRREGNNSSAIIIFFILWESLHKPNYKGPLGIQVSIQTSATNSKYVLY